MLAFVIQNQPHRTGADLGRELVCRFARHGSTFSKVGASDQPGAVHIADAPAVEPYEISRYGTLRTWAQALEAAELLEEPLTEEIIYP